MDVQLYTNSSSFPYFCWHMHVRLFNFSRSNRNIVVSYFAFRLYFPNDKWCCIYFQVLIYFFVFVIYLFVFVCVYVCVCVCVCLSVWNLLLSFCSGGNCLFSYYRVLRVLIKKNPLSDIYFANIFSLSIACCFILLMVFFEVQKFFFVQFSIKDCIVGIIAKNPLPNWRSQRFHSFRFYI